MSYKSSLNTKNIFMVLVVVAMANVMISHDWTSVICLLTVCASLSFILHQELGATEIEVKIEHLLSKIYEMKEANALEKDVLNNKIEHVAKQVSQIEAIAAKASMGQAFAFQRTGK